MPTIESARAWYPSSDPVHGIDHVLRVYRMAERLAKAESADLEIVRAAVLLHDAQSPTSGDSRANHHTASADFAGQVLKTEGWPEDRIAAVRDCIYAHRFRGNQQHPRTLEAQILFDADKLDAIGAIGVARAVSYAVLDDQPVYAPPSRQFLQTGQKEPGEPHSSYHEYLFKLRRLKDRLYTKSARSIAKKRHRIMVEFFTQLAAELNGEQ